MRQIYYESTGEFRLQPHTPCVRVRVYIPSIEDDPSIAITILERGETNQSGYPVFSMVKYYVERDRSYDQPLLIRQAIGLFDQLKKEMWPEDD